MNKQADGEKTCGTCRNEDTYHCAECENKSDYEQAQAYGEYINKEKAIIQLSWDLSEVELPRIKESLDKLPSVAIPSAEPKTGHWEWVQYDYNPQIGNWHCTECRCVVVECVDKNEKGGIPLYKYCPQCGAKMIEPQERSE